jgi:hypothetical protein
MFKKLVSNLPFNPSLLSQVSFYAKRVQQEESVRRMGFGLVALAMFIQMFAVIAPPEKSLAASANHIINGLRTRNDILAAWDRAGSDIPAIYGKFGLTRQDIANLPLNPNTVIRSNSGPDWWTIGRTSIGSRTDINYLYRLSEVALQTGPTTVYMRQLRAWDIRNPYNTYAAFTGKKADGTQFWILVDCGNYTQVGKYAPKEPKIEMRKTVLGNATNLKPGDSFTFRFEYRNMVPDSMAENVVIQDTFDLANYDITGPSNITLAGPNMRQGVGNLPYTTHYNVFDVTARLKNPFPGTNGKTCNVAKLVATNAPEVTAGPACVTVVTPCPYNAALPANDPNCKPPEEPCPYNPALPKSSPECKPPVKPCEFDPSVPAGDPKCKKPDVYCELVDTALDRTKREATFKTTVTSSNEKQTQILGYTYDFGDGTPAVTKESKLYTDTTKHIFAAGTFTTRVTIVYSSTGVNGRQQASCSSPITFDSDKPFGELKTVKNVTQNLEGDKAMNSVVKAGDVLEYTLTVTNTQTYDRGSYTAVDYIGDILDYATLDKDYLKTQGGTFDEKTSKVSFVLSAVPAKKDVSRTFRVTLKNPIPATNSPSSVSGTYDCKISNRFGNDIQMSVNCPTVKTIESLPNTGPGTSLLMGFTITTIVGYFFMRSRLMSKELAIIRSEYAPSGGSY